MKRNEAPSQQPNDESRSIIRRDKAPTTPPELDDDRVELMSWDAPLVPPST